MQCQNSVIEYSDFNFSWKPSVPQKQKYTLKVSDAKMNILGPMIFRTRPNFSRTLVITKMNFSQDFFLKLKKKEKVGIILIGGTETNIDRLSTEFIPLNKDDLKKVYDGVTIVRSREKIELKLDSSFDRLYPLTVKFVILNSEDTSDEVTIFNKKNKSERFHNIKNIRIDCVDPPVVTPPVVSEDPPSTAIESKTLALDPA